MTSTVNCGLGRRWVACHAQKNCSDWQLDVYTLAGSQAACETNNEAFTAAGGNMSRVRVLQDPVEAEKVSFGRLS